MRTRAEIIEAMVAEYPWAEIELDRPFSMVLCSECSEGIFPVSGASADIEAGLEQHAREHHQGYGCGSFSAWFRILRLRSLSYSYK